MFKSEKHNVLLSDMSLLLTTIIWGSGFIVTNYALESGLSPNYINLVRFLIASAVLFIIFRKVIFTISKSDIKYGVLSGFFMFMGFCSQTIGLKFTTPSSNAFLTAVNVIIVPFLVWFIYKKRPDMKVFIAAATCLVGIGFLTVQKGFSIGLGDSLTLLCAFFYACHIVSLGVSSKKVDSVKLVFIQLAVSSLLSLIVFMIFDFKDMLNIRLDRSFFNGNLAILYLGIFGTLIGFFIQTRAQKITTPSKTAIILSMEGVFGSLFSVFIGYDVFSVRMLVGGLTVILSIIFVELNIDIGGRKVEKNMFDNT